MLPSQSLDNDLRWVYKPGLGPASDYSYLMVSYTPSNAETRHRAAPTPARKMCPAAGSHQGARTASANPLHWWAPQAAAARHQLQKEAQLLNLQPSLHQELRYNCNTAVKRSVICPVPAIGITRGLTVSLAFLPASIAGVCVTWVVAEILFLRLCQSMSHCAHLLSKRDMVYPAEYNWLLITCLLSLFKYSWLLDIFWLVQSS